MSGLIGRLLCLLEIGSRNNADDGDRAQASSGEIGQFSVLKWRAATGDDENYVFAIAL